MVSETKVQWNKRVVFMEKCGRFLAWSSKESIESAENEVDTVSWKYAKDIEPEPQIPEYTMEELFEKLGTKFIIKKS